MPKFGCKFKTCNHRILGLLASDTPDVVPVGKANMLTAQLSKVLYINWLTKHHLQALFFFWIVVYCVFVPAVKEHLRGSLGLSEVHKAMLLLVSTELLIIYRVGTSCPHLSPSSATSDNAIRDHPQNRPTTHNGKRVGTFQPQVRK